MRSLSIVIPTYNGLHHLQRCLPSLRKYAPAGTEILVVDDASTDDTVPWIRREFPEVVLHRSAKNQGFCGSVNLGLQRARGDIIELLNNDTEVCAGWAEESLKHFDDPRVGSVAPLVLAMDSPHLIDSAGQNYHICGWATDRGHGQKLSPAYLQTCEVFGPSASSGLYRRSALEKTGGLLPEYGAYFEDTDLAFRLRWAGYRCIYEPQAVVYHTGSATYKQVSDKVIRLLSRNEELAYWINLSWPDLVRSFVPHLGFVGVRSLRKLWEGRFGPFLRGKLQALGQLSQIRSRRKELHKNIAAVAPFQDLALSRDTKVLSRGVQWLRHRKCA